MQRGSHWMHFSPTSSPPPSPNPSLVLPFYEVIDWRKAALVVDERQLLQVPHLMRSVSAYQLLAMRSQTGFLWETYFNTVEKIIMTTLEIIRRRLEYRQSVVTWSIPPGGVVSQPSYSMDLLDYPFYQPLQVPRPSVLKFTAVIQCETPALRASAPLAKLVRSIATAPHLAKVSQLLESGQAPSNMFCLCKQPPTLYILTHPHISTVLARHILVHTRILSRETLYCDRESWYAIIIGPPALKPLSRVTGFLGEAVNKVTP